MADDIDLNGGRSVENYFDSLPLAIKFSQFKLEQSVLYHFKDFAAGN